jgi:hypothetical protein
MKYIMFFVCLFQCVSTHAIEIGEALPDSAKLDGFKIYVRESVLSSTYSIEENGYTQYLTIDKGNKIQFIFVNDHNFRTPEGVHGNMPYDEVMRVPGAVSRTEKGWFHYVVLPSGWSAAFCVGDKTCTSEELVGQDQVISVFRR